MKSGKETTMNTVTPTDNVVHLFKRAHDNELYEPEVEKWPPRYTLFLILVTCGGFWATAAFAANQFINISNFSFFVTGL